MKEAAKITGNSSNNPGGGVFIADTGTFTMQDDASVTNNNSTDAYNGGGGVYNAGTMIMKDNAIVSGNTAEVGGGVSNAGIFMMEGGTIANNTATIAGGEVLNYNYGYTMILNATVQAGIYFNTTISNAYATGPQIYSEPGSPFEDGDGSPIVPDTY